MPSRRRSYRLVVLIALCFFARAAFYAVAYPVWEGYDEWSHYAVVERIALGHEALVPRDQPVSPRVAQSLRLAPLAWQLRGAPPPSLVHDAFWRLPADEREARERAFVALPARSGSGNPEEPFRAYEALQPPLYYWLMAPLLALMSGATLGVSVITLRLAGCVLAALTIPLVYKLARTALGPVHVSLGCAAIVALMPEFAIDVARVGNESLAVPLFTAVTWLGVQGYKSGFNLRRSIAIGVLVGCGLLTKAYFLSLLPALAVLFYLARRRSPVTPLAAFFRAAGAFLVAGAIAGWWYAHNVQTTGTASGLLEAVTVSSLAAGEFWSRAVHANYRAAIDAIFLSHVWFGGWSALTIRSWMYHLFYWVIALAAIGAMRRQARGLAGAAVIYFAFWTALLYYTALLFVSNGVSTCMGWYLYAAAGAEVALCCGGLRGLLPPRGAAWIPASGTFLFGILDLYTMHFVTIPYYTGMIAHRANGSLAPLRGGDWAKVGLSTAIERLGMFKDCWGSPAVLTSGWILYLASTTLLIGLGFRLGYGHVGRPTRSGTTPLHEETSAVGR